MTSTAIAQFDRAAVNRANALHSTGPRTSEGKQRSARNAIRHGLTARTAVLPSEDPAAFELHCRQFFDEHNPKTQTETQLVQELADTSWRLNRIPLLEANLLKEATRPECHSNPQPTIQSLSMLGLHSARLSRQFQKTLDQLRSIQADRRHLERRSLLDAASLCELNKKRGIPFDPAENGFVFSKSEIEAFAQQQMRHNEARRLEHVLLDPTRPPIRSDF
jgi:hypothetical protein